MGQLKAVRMELQNRSGTYFGSTKLRAVTSTALLLALTAVHNACLL